MAKVKAGVRIIFLGILFYWIEIGYPLKANHKQYYNANTSSHELQMKLSEYVKAKLKLILDQWQQQCLVSLSVVSDIQLV